MGATEGGVLGRDQQTPMPRPAREVEVTHLDWCRGPGSIPFVRGSHHGLQRKCRSALLECLAERCHGFLFRTSLFLI